MLAESSWGKKYTNGLKRIVSKMQIYCSLPQQLPLCEDDETSLGDNEVARDHIFRLYKAVLLYNMTFVGWQCRLTQYNNFPPSILELQHWDTQLEQIADAETSLPHQYQDLKDDIEQSTTTSGSMHDLDEHSRSERLRAENAERMNQLGAVDQRWLQGVHYGEQAHMRDNICQWFCSLNEYEEFLSFEEGSTPVLWITSNTGTGKTALLTALIERMLETPQPQQLSYFFCSDSGPELNNATTLMKTLVWSILREQRSLTSYLDAHLYRTKRTRFDSSSDFPALAALFYSIVSDEYFHPTYFVVDALDECSRDDAGLDNLLRVISLTSHRQSKVKWLISSAFGDRICSVLKCVDGYKHLDMDSEFKGAISQHIQHSASKLAEEKAYDESMRARVVDLISNLAGANYLCVNIICATLKSVDKWYADEVLSEIDSGELNHLYSYAMRQIENLPRKDPTFCKSVLATMSTVYRPLSLLELAMLSDLPSLVDPKAMVEKCCAFLVVHDGIVYFLHQSAKEYLQNCLGEDHSPGRVHARICQQALGYLINPNVDLQQALKEKSGPNQQSKKNSNCLVEYACTYWGAHLCAIYDIKEHLTLLQSVEEFLRNGFLPWLEALGAVNQLSLAGTIFHKFETFLMVCPFDSLPIPDLPGFSRY